MITLVVDTISGFTFGVASSSVLESVRSSAGDCSVDGEHLLHARASHLPSLTAAVVGAIPFGTR